CITSVRGQTHAPLTLRVADNASSDDTRARLERLTTPDERHDFQQNRGFSAAHNVLIASAPADFYLALNPDVVLTPQFVARLVAALETAPPAGSGTGKLLRLPNVGPHAHDIIDSTGIVMLPSQRHLDRGADREDNGQYARAEPVFGASGAAAMYRRTMLEDT